MIVACKDATAKHAARRALIEQLASPQRTDAAYQAYNKTASEYRRSTAVWLARMQALCAGLMNRIAGLGAEPTAPALDAICGALAELERLLDAHAAATEALDSAIALLASEQ